MSKEKKQIYRFLNNPAEPVKFAIVGCLNTFVDVAAFWLLSSQMQMPILLANTLSYSLGIINSYSINKLWTFRNTAYQDSPINQLPKFILISLGALCISNIIVWIVVIFLQPLWAKLIATAITFGWNFGASKKWVYHSRITNYT